MAGQKQLMIEAITALVIGEQTGEDVLLDRIANGETMAALARSLGFSRNMLSQHLVRDDQRRALLTRARESGADALAEETVEIADAASPSNANVARLKIEQRKWLASKVLPDIYGEKQQASVIVNVNTLHLEALRQLRDERIRTVDVSRVSQSHGAPAQLTQ